MSDKSVTFRLDLETYARLIGHFPQPGAKGNMEALLDAFENQGVDNGSTAEVARLQDELRHAKEELAKVTADFDASYKERGDLLDQKQEEIQTLKAQIEQMISPEALEEVRIELQAANDRLASMESETVNWAKISSVLDPAYVAVIEEITRRLIEKFHLPSLEPQAVLVTFFMKYYYCQEVEFSGMPFIIKPKEILEIVQTVYPAMEKNTLKKALSVE